MMGTHPCGEAASPLREDEEEWVDLALRVRDLMTSS